MDRHSTTTLSPGRPSFWVLVVTIIVLLFLLLLSTDAFGATATALSNVHYGGVPCHPTTTA